MAKFPVYFDCFLRSCATNPDINWLIITNTPAPPNAPPNVRFHQTTEAELVHRFTTKMGPELTAAGLNLDAQATLDLFTKVVAAYRSGQFLDLKITLGLVFDDLLSEYDFWGHCDFDMVFGDLRKFLTEEILTVHDKVLCRGHLTLYRNTPKVNRAFMLTCPGVPQFKDVLLTARTALFEEWLGLYLIFRYHDFPQYQAEFIADILPPTNWKITRFEGAALHNYPEQVFYWYKGKVFHAHYNCDRGVVDDEYAYIHFQKRRMPAPAFNPFETNGFLVTPDGFVPYRREPLVAADFARYNRTRWRPYPELVQHVKQALRRRLGLAPPVHVVRPGS